MKRPNWTSISSPSPQAIDGAPSAAARISKGRRGQYADALAWIGRNGLPLGSEPWKFLADGGVYLNVSQFPLELDPLFRWADRRPGIDNVFFLHDILPLETPEYFKPAEYPRHLRRLRTVARRGRAAIVSTGVVREALQRRLAELGRRDMPILVAPPPADLTFSCTARTETITGRHPYFVICGTIEPRKNHSLLLHIWRDVVARLGQMAPKLVVIGVRGWENEHVIDLLERCPGPSRARHRSIWVADAERQATAAGRPSAADALVRRRLWLTGDRGPCGGGACHCFRHSGVPRDRRRSNFDDRSDGRSQVAGRHMRLRRHRLYSKTRVARSERKLPRSGNGPPSSRRSRTLFSI